jgi:hypothetical protein
MLAKCIGIRQVIHYKIHITSVIFCFWEVKKIHGRNALRLILRFPTLLNTLTARNAMSELKSVFPICEKEPSIDNGVRIVYNLLHSTQIKSWTTVCYSHVQYFLFRQWWFCCAAVRPDWDQVDVSAVLHSASRHLCCLLLHALYLLQDSSRKQVSARTVHTPEKHVNIGPFLKPFKQQYSISYSLTYFANLKLFGLQVVASN